jgi:hypothetical protein
MVNSCNVATKGFLVFDYDTRSTNFGYTHEVASGHASTKFAVSVSSIHGSATIIADHEDSLFNLYLSDFTQTTGAFAKFFVSSNNKINDINYIELAALVICNATNTPYNAEIHNTNQLTGTTYLSTNIKTNIQVGNSLT